MNLYFSLSSDKHLDKYSNLSVGLKKIYKKCVISFFIDQLEYLSYEDLKHNKYSSIDNFQKENSIIFWKIAQIELLHQVYFDK